MRNHFTNFPKKIWQLICNKAKEVVGNPNREGTWL